ISAAGKLVYTGEAFNIGANKWIVKVFSVPGSKVGVAITSDGLMTFSIPGLETLDTINLSLIDFSVAPDCTGEKLYVRRGTFIEGYTLNPDTGILDKTPFLTITNVAPVFVQHSYGNALLISRDGTTLTASEPGFTTPEDDLKPQVTFFDAATGERKGAAPFEDGLVNPTVGSTLPCCEESPVLLDVERLAAGGISIRVTGKVGQQYELQKSPDLNFWEKLSDIQLSVSPFSYSDTQPADTTRFYRLRW
ncbi:MAG TPA: hypothetical protein VM735_07100, partial [Candidatus Kapabacteria bacterium]|nr:hypothetical protein [Candidatus Kapabacteria bacterium]